MKKIAILLSAIILVLCICCSCDINHTPPSNSDTNNESKSSTESRAESESSPAENNQDLHISLDNLQNCEPEDVGWYGFESYEDLKNQIASLGSDKSILSQGKETYGVAWETFLKAHSVQSTIKTPKLNGKDIALWNQEGFDSISVCTKEMFNLPWVVYQSIYKDNHFHIFVAELSIISNLNVSNRQSCSEIVKMLDPSMPNTDNYQDYDTVTSVVEKTITIMNGKTMSVLVYDYVDSCDDRVYVIAYYENMLIRFIFHPDELDNEFWSSFDMA